VLGRAVAAGHVLGAAAGLRETGRLHEVIGERHRWHAVCGHLHELDGDLPAAATAYADTARRATTVAERDYLVRQAARARAAAVTGTTEMRLRFVPGCRGEPLVTVSDDATQQGPSPRHANRLIHG
jgi:hypothetical protein